MAMNRLLLTASNSVACSLRNSHVGGGITTSSSPAAEAARFLTARHFSDLAADATGTALPSTDAGNNERQPAIDTSNLELKAGQVRGYSFKLNYGFVLPDGVDRREARDKDMYFVHRNNVKVQIFEGGETFRPNLRNKMRVQFRAVPPRDGNVSGEALEVTMEDGKLIPPFLPGYFEGYARDRKAKFGEEVFDVFETCTDQTELENKIVAAYEKAKYNIDRQRERVKRAEELTGHKLLK